MRLQSDPGQAWSRTRRLTAVANKGTDTIHWAVTKVGSPARTLCIGDQVQQQQPDPSGRPPANRFRWRRRRGAVAHLLSTGEVVLPNNLFVLLQDEDLKMTFQEVIFPILAKCPGSPLRLPPHPFRNIRVVRGATVLQRACAAQFQRDLSSGWDLSLSPIHSPTLFDSSARWRITERALACAGLRSSCAPPCRFTPLHVHSTTSARPGTALWTCKSFSDSAWGGPREAPACSFHSNPTPQASRFKPHTPSLKPQASSLKPQASTPNP